MNQQTMAWPFSRTTSILCALTTAHAALILLVWIAAFVFDAQVINARVWLVGAWAWALWLFVLALRFKQDTKLIVATVAVCAALFVPSVSTIYSFTMWAIGGFAP